MATITIPRELSQNKDLVAVPRNMYDEYVAWLKEIKSSKTFKPTKAELRSLERGRKNFREGKFIEWNKLKYELENPGRPARRKNS